MPRRALVLIVMCTACGGNPAGPAGAISTNTATIISVQIVPSTTALKVGATEQFSMTETMSSGVPPPCPAPYWSVTDPAIATATLSGLVTAIAPGRTTLTLLFCGKTDARRLEIAPQATIIFVSGRVVPSTAAPDH
jgi:uncharacterized protein YjdB